MAGATVKYEKFDFGIAIGYHLIFPCDIIFQTGFDLLLVCKALCYFPSVDLWSQVVDSR